jgi:cobalt-zinc-cadmium efflux system membrane fusion protein
MEDMEKNTIALRLAALAAALGLALIACDRVETSTPEPQRQESASAGDVPTRPAEADPADWCGGHGVPESMCTKCHPELVSKFEAAGDWCAEHGYPESVCPQCHPMAPPEGAAAKHGDDEHEGGHSGHADSGHADSEHTGQRRGVAHDWCAEHALPESKCTKCHPELAADFRDRGDWCAEHGFPESVCPQCHPVEPPEGYVARPFEEGTVIRLQKTEHEARAGIAVAEARVLPMGSGVEAPARLEFDRNRTAAVRAPVSGIVREVLVDLGDRVEAGAPIFVLTSVEVGDLQARERAAREALEVAEANLARHERLEADELVTVREVELTRREVEAARARLASVRGALALTGSSRKGGRFTVRAPRAGSVVERPAVVGAAVDPSTPLATIVDTTRMWAFVDIPARDAGSVRLGQRASISIRGADDVTSVGEVTWISPAVDPRTRTVAVRVELPNPDGRLRAHQFAAATIDVGRARAQVAVPREALQRIDRATVVFVRIDEAVYEPRVVEPGRRSGALVQVRGDLEAGESVVTTGAFLLKTELQSDSIGAGCCEVGE